MKTLLLTALFFVSFSTYARSLHPCTPTEREYVPNQISCVDGETYYSITIHYSVSPDIPLCQGDQKIRLKTATVEISDKMGNNPQRKVYVGSDQFSYEYSDEAFFLTEDLDLKDCVVPADGGFSIGSL